MRELTKDEKKLLDNFYSEMESVTSFGFCRSISRKRRRELYSIYNDITGENLTPNTGCTTCINNMLKELFMLYNYKEQKKKKEIKDD